MGNVLIIDDDETICTALQEMVISIGHHADYSLNLREGIKRAVSTFYDVVFLDVNLPDGNGIKAIERIKNVSQPPEIVIITGLGDPDGAELAINNGAWDYLQKPISPKKVIQPLQRLLQYREELNKNWGQPLLLKRNKIIGSSKQIQACIERAGQASGNNANVLLHGETGTGKELFAKAIHDNSVRSDKNYVVVDCAALPETLVGSTLFGHVKGAFTGADHQSDGLIKMADGGTLFLDEVGELSLNLQKAFLRVLQEHCFRPVGGNHEIKSNFRLISATNKAIDRMVEAGQFREDLLHRLRTLTIEIPPLRQHLKDIPELANHYSRKICERYGIIAKEFSDDFFDALKSYEWPGNVRELIHTLESTINQAQHASVILPQHLPKHIRARITRASVARADNLSKESDLNIAKASFYSFPWTPSRFRDFRTSVVEEAEKAYMQNLLTFTEGSIKEACRISDLSRTRIYAIMKKHNITKPL